MAFLDSRLLLLLIFLMFDLTIHQEKMCLAFFSRKNITQSLHGEIARYKCNELTKYYFFKSHYFSNYERIIKHAFLGQSGHTRCLL